MVPGTEIESRISLLQSRLKEKEIEGALFVYPVDIYYFTGSRQTSVLWVPADGIAVLLVRKSYTRALGEAVKSDVRPFPPTRDFPTLFSGIKKIGLTFDVMPVQQYEFYAKLLAGREFIDVSMINRELRSVKSAWELDQMRVSGRMLCDAFSRVPEILRPGMRELDLAAEFEYILRKSGSDGYLRIRAFHQEIVGLAVSGSNAATPGCFDGPVTGKGLSNAAPYGPSRDVILKDTPIIIDYGLIYNGYIVDMTRLFAFGSLPPELTKAFAVSREIEDRTVQNLKPGSICEDLFAAAQHMAGDAGLGDMFMGFPGEQAKFVGHGVGLELDELPVLAQKFKSPLQEGQTVAVEPKFAFPGLGVVGIENTYAVGRTGGERLTALPDDIIYL